MLRQRQFRRISSRDKFESRNYWQKFGRNLFNRSFFQKLRTKTSKNLDVWSNPLRKLNVNIKSIERWAGLNYRSKAAVSQQNSSFLCTHSYGKSLGLSTIPHIAYNQVFVSYSGFLDNRMKFVKKNCFLEKLLDLFWLKTNGVPHHLRQSFKKLLSIGHTKGRSTGHWSDNLQIVLHEAKYWCSSQFFFFFRIF